MGAGSGLGEMASGIATLFQDSPTKAIDMPDIMARGAVRAYADTANPLFTLNSAMQPAYLGLGANNLQSMLFGSPGGQQTVRVGAGRPDSQGNFSKYYSFQLDTPQSPGLFDLYGQAIPRLQGLQDQGVAGQLGMLNKYLPQAQAYQQQANPELEALRKALGLAANRQVAMGGTLDPTMRNAITSGVRADWANRGLGQTMPAQLNEALQLYGGGEALRNNRLNTAGGLFGQLSQYQPDYSRWIMGMGSNALQQGMSAVGQQQPLAYQGSMYDPFNSVAAGGAVASERNRMADNAARSQAWGSTIGGLFDTIGSIYTGGMSGAMGG